MIITIEPGIYFNNHLLDKYIKDENSNKYLNIDFLQKFRNFGGIRIEDDVLVTETGYVCLTANAPKEIAEIEAIMAIH